MAGFLLYQNALADEAKGDLDLSQLFRTQSSRADQTLLYKMLNGSPGFAPLPRGKTPMTLIFPAKSEDTSARSTCVALELSQPLSSRTYTMPAEWTHDLNVFDANDFPKYDFSVISGVIQDTSTIINQPQNEVRAAFVKFVKESFFTRGNVRFSGILPQLMLSDNTVTHEFLDRFNEVTNDYEGRLTSTDTSLLIRRLPDILKELYTNCYLVIMLERNDVTAPYVQYLGDFNYDAHKTGSAPVRVFVCCRKGSGLEFAMYKPKDVRNLFRPGKGSDVEKFNFNLARHLMNGGSTSTFVDKVNNSNRPQPLTSQPPTSSVGDEPTWWNWFIQ